MLNLFEDTRANPHFRKFEIGDVLFAEYTCPIEEKSIGIWTHTDYLVHVVSGRKSWHTTNGSWTAEAGQTLFFKKGAAVVEQFFDEDFCVLLFFIPDDFVRESVKENAGIMKSPTPGIGVPLPAILVNNDPALSIFFESMHSYFHAAEQPSEPLLKLKLRELILSILMSRNNPELASYFLSLANNTAPRLREIMESNFRYNLSLEDFARLCHRSLSSFKRDFQQQSREPPGKWLHRKRLEYAAVLLRAGEMSVSQIVFECGFEDMSHFSKAFKAKFGVPPTGFRSQADIRG
jgi:AraC-like DNA-binding protein